jgi:hypothetical protein
MNQWRRRYETPKTITKARAAVEKWACRVAVAADDF